jgi:hypothetical protein
MDLHKKLFDAAAADLLLQERRANHDTKIGNRPFENVAQFRYVFGNDSKKT